MIHEDAVFRFPEYQSVASDARRAQHHSPRTHPQTRRVGGHTGAEAVSPPCEPPELDWGERRVALKTGDYTVMGMENLLALERKNLADLVACTVTYRRPFLAACDRLARFRWKAILIEATYEDIKGGFESFAIPSAVHPNAVCGTLDAIEAKFGIPFIYASTVQDLATERAASWLSKHFTYWWLEQQGLGRVLIDSDRL